MRTARRRKYRATREERRLMPKRAIDEGELR
jgi:hypothetical protein